jgi:hypothetical protein
VPNLPADWPGGRIAVVVPVRRDVAGLPALAERLEAALGGSAWRLRLVIDADPEESVRPAHDLASADDRIAVSGLAFDGGSAAAVRQGLAAEPDADLWICLEAGVPEAVGAMTVLVERLTRGDVEAVLAEVGRTAGPVPLRLRALAARALPGVVGPRVSMSVLAPRARSAVLAVDGEDVRTSLSRAGLPFAELRIPGQGRR